MSIRRNLERTSVAVIVDQFKGGDLAEQIGEAAVKAITKGMGSAEWNRYMALFCDTKEELAQLTLARDTDESWMPQMRAYIVSNAVCAGVTGTATDNGLTGNSVEPTSAAPEGTAEPTTLRGQLGFEIPKF